MTRHRPEPVSGVRTRRRIPARSLPATASLEVLGLEPTRLEPTRIGHCPRTKAYLQRRTAEGKPEPEIIRCLKRYLAGELFKALTSTNTTHNQQPSTA